MTPKLMKMRSCLAEKNNVEKIPQNELAIILSPSGFDVFPPASYIGSSLD